MYKRQSHLLESVGVALPKPLFDTKLAGYLVHPDFHADTLEQAAAHFLDLHIEEQSEGATQGTLDFDEPDDSAQRNDNQLPRHTAIVGLLARKLADSLDQREQFSLLESVEIPVSRVLYLSLIHIFLPLPWSRSQSRTRLPLALRPSRFLWL